MALYDKVLRPAAFLIDPERVHEGAMWALERGLFQSRPFADPRLKQALFGTQFDNPLGLAAGFDKNAAALNYWDRLGFGFVECGTVTFHAQEGNERPRLFRVPEDHALINRLGFNNVGARAVATRLAAATPRIPVGVNLGKSKITPIEQAAMDYRESFQLLHSFGSYFVVNVSSPNTPGLRTLQEKGPLTEILAALREIDDARPLFVKVAPDLTLNALNDVVEVAMGAKVTGLIATNTTVERGGLTADPGEDGGLSGAPLLVRSNEILAHLFRTCPREMILMGVGGIFTGEDIYRKIRLGAHLCQVYTGWIYGGPHMVPDALEKLVLLMQRDGVSSLAEIRGADA